MRRFGNRVALEHYNPDVHKLPDNHDTRRALKALARKRARQQARVAVQLEGKLRRAIAPYVGKVMTPELRAEMVEACTRALSPAGGVRVTEEFVEQALAAAGVVHVHPAGAS